MKNSYSLDNILDIWEKDEIIGKNERIYLEKGYTNWIDWRKDKMKNHGVCIKEWYKKELNIDEILNFRVGAFPSIFNYFKPYLNGDGNNYLKIEETKIKNYEKLYLKNKEKIESIINHFPKEINFIGWERYNEIILTEGHHRAIAIARILNNGGILDKNIKLNLYYHPVLAEDKIKNIDYLDLKDYN